MSTGIMLIGHRCDHACRYWAPRNGWALSCLVVVLTLVFGGEVLAENSELHSYGDPSVRAAVDTQVKRIYELAAGPCKHIELITRDNPLQQRDALGTEVTASIIDGAEGRIVANVWTRRGKYSIEFYRVGNKLLNVYETFTFFQESAPRDAWHNFMGLAAWERRMYFDARGEVGYAETRGREAPAPEIGGKRIQQQAQRLVKLLSGSQARWERR